MGPDYTFETAARHAGFARIAGVDEVGRGPLAGPVTAAAVILDPACIPDGLNDSKTLSAKKRALLSEELLDCAEVSIAHATVQEIEEINILRASHLAMERAIAGLAVAALALSRDQLLHPKLSVAIFAQNGVYAYFSAAFVPILFGMFLPGATLRAAAARPRLLFKDPIALLSAGWLHERFGAEVICMIRNPLAFRYGAMPPQLHLSDADLDALIAYFRSLRTGPSTEQ